MATIPHPPPRRTRSLGLTLCQLAVPALAIPSAIGVATFFRIADGVDHWTLQGVIAASGFELMNVGLAVLDIRHPGLHPTVQRVRFWSVTTAITLNIIAHYGERVPQLDRIDPVAGLLALVASVPLAVLYVALAGLLHELAACDHTAAASGAERAAELATMHTELATRGREAEQAGTALASSRAQHAAERARLQGEARAQQQGLAAELARLQGEARAQQQGLATELAAARARSASLHEELVLAREAHTRELQAARAASARAEGHSQQRTDECAGLRTQLATQADHSRAALMREAQALRSAHGWGASEIGRQLGWPESTVRGWLPAAHAVSAAD